MSMIKFVLKISVAMSVLLMVTSCARWVTPFITPMVSTELLSLKSGEYSLDKSHSAVLFKVQHMGLSTYVGRFKNVDATLEFDPENIAVAKLTALVEINSLDINDDDLKEDLMGRSWFHQASYPQAKFTTTDVRPVSQNSFEFTGELDWRGIKKPLVLMATFHGGANNILTGKYTLGFSATGSFNRSDFNMSSFIPLVGDKITLEAFAEFQRN